MFILLSVKLLRKLVLFFLLILAALLTDKDECVFFESVRRIYIRFIEQHRVLKFYWVNSNASDKPFGNSIVSKCNHADRGSCADVVTREEVRAVS